MVLYVQKKHCSVLFHFIHFERSSSGIRVCVAKLKKLAWKWTKDSLKPFHFFRIKYIAFLVYSIHRNIECVPFFQKSLFVFFFEYLRRNEKREKRIVNFNLTQLMFIVDFSILFCVIILNKTEFSSIPYLCFVSEKNEEMRNDFLTLFSSFLLYFSSLFLEYFVFLFVKSISEMKTKEKTKIWWHYVPFHLLCGSYTNRL